MKDKIYLGIDIGGSGIKGALVDVKTGELITDRFRIPTPQPATPEAVAEVIKEICKHFKWKDAVGCGYPGVVQNGVAKTAANIDKAWINTDVEGLIKKMTGSPAKVLNDADAAAIAEMKYGAGRKNRGLIITITIGTGVGVAMFTQKKLVPNCELGHILLPEFGEAEKWMSDGARKALKLEWNEWMERIDFYLKHLESLFYPDMIIIGGGLAKKLDPEKMPFTTQCQVVPAKLLNEAGIIGAAYAASKLE